MTANLRFKYPLSASSLSRSPSPQSSKKQDVGSNKEKQKRKKELLQKSSTYLDAANVGPLKETRSKLGWEFVAKFQSEDAFYDSKIMEEIRFFFSSYFTISRLNFAANL